MNRASSLLLAAVAVAVLGLTGCRPPGPPVIVSAPGRTGGDVEQVRAVDAATFRDAVGRPASEEEAQQSTAPRYFYLLEPPRRLTGEQAAGLTVSTDVLPAGTEVLLFDDTGEVLVELMISAAPEALAVDRISHTLHPRRMSAVSAIRITAPPSWDLPGELSDEPVLELGGGSRFYGAEVSAGTLALGAASALAVSSASTVEWRLTLPATLDGGRLEVDYVFDDTAGGDPWASLELSGAGAAVSLRARLASGAGTIAIPGPALGFTPQEVRVAAAGEGVGVRRIEWHEAVARAPAAAEDRGGGGAAAGAAVVAPIPADLATILSGYPRSAWRHADFEVFAWAAYPRVLVFDTADYATQARLFRRLAFFVEKRGFRGRLLRDAELAGRHGWNAHNYRPEGLAPFFTEAERQGLALNEEEQTLREILLANGIIRRVEDGYAPGDGGVLSISQSSYPLLRELLITHEAFHGVFYEENAFRDGVQEVWQGLNDAERDYWRGLLGYMTYDPTDEYLMVNEFQAYLMQQTLDRVRGYLRGVLAPRYARARPNRRAEIERFLSEYPETFLRSAQAVEQILRSVSPLEAGEVLLLLPADGEA
jgi:hypothetical protein